MRVQVETSGILHQDLPEEVDVVVSPKTQRVLYRGPVRAWKYIIRAGETAPPLELAERPEYVYDGLPYYSTQRKGTYSRLARPWDSHMGQTTRLEGHIPLADRRTVYVQPCDEEILGGGSADNQLNMLECLNSARQFGYTLGLQLHKIAGVE